MTDLLTFDVQHDPTPVDGNGRVHKVGVDHWRCPSCGGLTYGTDPEARCFPCEDEAENIPAQRVKIEEWGGVALGEEDWR